MAVAHKRVKDLGRREQQDRVDGVMTWSGLTGEPVDVHGRRGPLA